MRLFALQLAPNRSELVTLSRHGDGESSPGLRALCPLSWNVTMAMIGESRLSCGTYGGVSRGCTMIHRKSGIGVFALVASLVFAAQGIPLSQADASTAH